MNVKAMSEQSIRAALETLQEVQKGCAPTTREWQEASPIIHSLCAEMARRQAVRS